MSRGLSRLKPTCKKAKGLQVGQEGAVVRLHAQTNINLTFGEGALVKFFQCLCTLFFFMALLHTFIPSRFVASPLTALLSCAYWFRLANGI